MNDREFDREIDKMIDNTVLNLGRGKRRYTLYRLLLNLKAKLNLAVYDPN